MAFFGKKGVATTASRSGDRDSGGKDYKNTDGPGGKPNDYGPRKGASQKQRWDAKESEYGLSPWFSGGAQMPWSGPEGQERGQRAPFFTPDPADPRNAGYLRNQMSPEQMQMVEAKNAAGNQMRQQAYGDDPAIAAARAAGDMKGYIAAMQALKARGEEQRFVDQGGTPEVWRDRNNPDNAWPVPKSPSGNYQYGPGRPGPTPPGVAQSMPPADNPMFEGYQPGPAAPAMSTGQDGLGNMGLLAQLLSRGTGGKPPTGMLGAIGTKAPPAMPTPEKRGVRRGGGRVD